MRLLVLDAAVGVLLLGAIGLAAKTQGGRVVSHRLRICGWALIAVPLPAAVAAHTALRLPTGVDQACFLAGVVAFAVGAALVLRREDEDWSEPHDDDAPPWWPAFERALRDYEQDLARRPWLRT